MNAESRIVRQLQEIPPLLPEQPDRFEQVHRRVVRRRRRVAAVSASATVVVIVAAGSVLASRATGDPTNDRGVDPATSATTSPVPLPPPTPSPTSGAVTTVPGKNGRLVHTGTGTQTLALGRRPVGLNAVSMAVACFSPGIITWPDDASYYCYRESVSTSEHPRIVAWYDLSLDPDQQTVTIEASPGTAWRITTNYVPEAH